MLRINPIIKRILRNECLFMVVDCLKNIAAGYYRLPCSAMGKTMTNQMSFRFYTAELAKKDWREYIRTPNPVAADLLSQMGYNQSERIQVKIEFLRMLVKLEVDPARMQLIIGFFDQYFTLTDEEEMALKKEIEQLEPHEAEEVFRIETAWERRGRAIGRDEGKNEVARRMLSTGMSIEDIQTFTDLTEADIRKL